MRESSSRRDQAKNCWGWFCLLKFAYIVHWFLAIIGMTAPLLRQNATGANALVWLSHVPDQPQLLLDSHLDWTLFIQSKVYSQQFASTFTQFDSPSNYRRLELFFLMKPASTTFSVHVCDLLLASFCLPHYVFCAKASSTHSGCMVALPSLTGQPTTVHKSLTPTSPTVVAPSLPLLPVLLPSQAAAAAAVAAAGLPRSFPLQLRLLLPLAAIASLSLLVLLPLLSLPLLPIAKLPAPHSVRLLYKFRKSAATISYNWLQYVTIFKSRPCAGNIILSFLSTEYWHAGHMPSKYSNCMWGF